MDWHSIGIGLVVGAYFLPTIVAGVRRQRWGLVFVVNLLLGWTVLGWIAAVLMAVWPAKSKYVEVPYFGDVYDSNRSPDARISTIRTPITGSGKSERLAELIRQNGSKISG